MSTGSLPTSKRVSSQAERIAVVKRTELVEAAVAELVETGWRGLRMQSVADRVGVSRQTIYNTFGSRSGLAAAIVEHLTESFLEGFAIAFAGHDDDHIRWHAGVRYLFTRGSEDRALRAMLGADTGDEFLHLLTTGSGPLINTARERIAYVILEETPDVPAARALAVAEVVTRMALSHIVRAVDSLEASTDVVASMIAGFLHDDAV